MPKIDDQRIMDLAVSLGRNLSVSSANKLIRLVHDNWEAQERGQLHKPDMLSLIKMGFERFSSDPRDRFYGLFGLVDSEQWPMHPDYILTLDEVKLGFTTGLIQASGRLGVLCLSGFGFELPGSRKFPTWVPQYISSGTKKFDFIFSVPKVSKAFVQEELESRFCGLAEGFITFMRATALDIVAPFLLSEVNDPQEPDDITDVLLGIDVHDLIDIMELVEQEEMDEEIGYWLINSSSTGDEITRAHALEKFCGRSGNPDTLKWPYGTYGCDKNL